MEYEICYLIGESKEMETEKIKEKIRKIIVGEGGNFSDFKFMDKRKMAYEIENEVRGTFFANRFEISKKDNNQEPETELKNAVKGITEKLYLEKDILRFIIVKADSVPSPENKEEVKKSLVVPDPAKSEKTKDSKREKKENIRQFEKPKDKKHAKKETLKKIAKVEKLKDIDKKLEEILKI